MSFSAICLALRVLLTGVSLGFSSLILSFNEAGFEFDLVSCKAVLVVDAVELLWDDDDDEVEDNDEVEAEAIVDLDTVVVTGDIEIPVVVGIFLDWLLISLVLLEVMLEVEPVLVVEFVKLLLAADNALASICRALLVDFTITSFSFSSLSLSFLVDDASVLPLAFVTGGGFVSDDEDMLEEVEEEDEERDEDEFTDVADDDFVAADESVV